MDIIQYNDFAKLDIRVGTIVLAESVPKSTKLLRLEIDFGTEGKRQIVAGIASLVPYVLDGNPANMAGMQVCAVLNLEPRKLMGLESHGMILAAHNEQERICLVSCPQAQNGAKLG